jgi:two-component system chemotaxis response regulator CheY
MSIYGKLSFLVVDDMSTLRKLVSQQLRALGATQIIEATDGKIAKEILEKKASDGVPIQFIISDWNMPNCTGIELLRFCRSHPLYKDIPFLMVTAETETSQISEANAAGVDSYVVKPFTPSSFTEKLLAVYKKRLGNK